LAEVLKEERITKVALYAISTSTTQKTASGDPTPHTPLKGSLRHEVAKVLV
jgi:hypothetical protein